LLKDDEVLYAYEFFGSRYDLGNKLDWLKTNIDIGLMKEEFRDELIAHMKDKIREIEE
jgi:UTP--glucose-1-phosphate uridylyltransferase